MKKLLFPLLFLTLVGCTSGNTSQPDQKPTLSTPEAQEKAENYCSWLFHMTKFIMANHQEGIKIEQVLDNLKEVGPDHYRIFEAITYDAYKAPIGNTEEEKMIYIQQFSDAIYTTCYDNEKENDEKKPRI